MHGGNKGTGGRAGKEDRRPDAGSREAAPVERRSSEPTAGGGRLEARGALSKVNWQTALYAFVLGLACLVLVPLTSLWWIVPVLGAFVPLALAVLDGGGPKVGRARDEGSKERELLDALAERGEITPATAAMRTSLTVDEAAGMLEDLAGKGYLKLRADDGTLAYAVPDRNHPAAVDAPPEPADPKAEAGETPERLDEPLSERELEVLALLASGRTNPEIARELYVALGTVKSHTGNVYRKLGAANRAEAVSRARKLNLLR